MNHRDLSILQEAMIGHLRQDFRKKGQLYSFAAVLTSLGKILFLSASANISDEGAMRMLEGGLSARILQNGYRAVGTCQICGSIDEEAVHIFLEHSDGNAYQVEIPYMNGAVRDLNLRRAVTVSVVPRFFLSVMSRPA